MRKTRAQPVTATTRQTIAVPVSTPISFTEPTTVPVPGVTVASNATIATTAQTPTMTRALERCGIPNSDSDFFTNLQGVDRASRLSSRFGSEGNMTKFDEISGRADGDRIVGGFDVPNGAGSECWQV